MTAMTDANNEEIRGACFAWQQDDLVGGGPGTSLEEGYRNNNACEKNTVMQGAAFLLTLPGNPNPHLARGRPRPREKERGLLGRNVGKSTYFPETNG